MDKKLIDKAQEMYDMMEQRKRDNGDTFYALKDNAPQWMSNVAMEAHGERFPDDYIYEFIVDALAMIADADENADIDDLINEIEPDVYTASLTHWLSSNNYNISYLTEALQEFDIKDGFEALAWAQALAKQEVARDLVSALEKLIEENEGEDEKEEEEE